MEERSFSVEVLGCKIKSYYIKNASLAGELLNELTGQEQLFGIDIETCPKDEHRHVPKAGLSPWLSRIRLIQVYDGEECFVFDMNEIPIAIFYPFLETNRFIAHNAVFELSNFLHNGVRNMSISCTMLIAKLIMHATYPTDSGLAASLAALVKMCFDIDLEKALQISDFSQNELTYEQVEYAALDAIYVIKLAEKMGHGLRKLGLERIYQITKEAQAPIARLQLNGLNLDTEYYIKLIDKWRDELYSAKKHVLKLTKLEDLTSAKLAGWLEKNLPQDVLDIWPRTETERLSTSSDTFADFSYLEVVEPFSAFQKKAKLTSSFGHNMLGMINPVTKRIHSSYKLLGARTGRLSSTSPNLQQLPRDEEVRAAFIPNEGNVFVRADYNQIELRVAAELSQDEMMLKAYREGIDLHALTASKVSGKPLEDVSKSDRQMAKALNFGLLFGLGAAKFSHYARKSYKVDVPHEDALEAVDVFRETYYGYREWQMDISSKASETMSVRTPSGKLRKLMQENCYGASMNTPVQGGAAEVMLIALAKIFRKGLRLVNCVHDEILIEVPNHLELINSAKRTLTKCMTEAFLEVFPKGITRGLVEPNHGMNWADAK